MEEMTMNDESSDKQEEVKPQEHSATPLSAGLEEAARAFATDLPHDDMAELVPSQPGQRPLGPSSFEAKANFADSETPISSRVHPVC
jgi:hypothetical protein